MLNLPHLARLELRGTVNWRGQTRDWSRPEIVMLNPDKPVEKSGTGQQEVA